MGQLAPVSIVMSRETLRVLLDAGGTRDEMAMACRIARAASRRKRYAAHQQTRRATQAHCNRGRALTQASSLLLPVRAPASRTESDAARSTCGCRGARPTAGLRRNSSPKAPVSIPHGDAEGLHAEEPHCTGHSSVTNTHNRCADRFFPSHSRGPPMPIRFSTRSGALVCELLTRDALSNLPIELAGSGL